MEQLKDFTLNEERFLSLLEKLIGESEFLQNNPPSLVPEEERACKHVLETLKPFTTENGGKLEVEKVEYVKNRGNIMITLPGESEKCFSFVGSHLDVVPANPETWERNPFELVREGDKLYGRGTTDCLGHVALITTLFTQFAAFEKKLPFTIHGVFIASEEAAAPGVGVDQLMATGKLDKLKNGPVLWVDCADSQPCIGTAGAISWGLKAIGHLFHSGLPHKAINSIELANEACKEIQAEFFEKFPPHELETKYKYATPSTMKPTQICCPKGGLNQIPPSCTIQGDIRLTPFYKSADVKDVINKKVAALNENITSLATRGPASKYEITLADGSTKQGVLEFTWGELDMVGIACNLESPLYKAVCKSVEQVLGEAKPYAICGSLPLVDQMQANGFDIQLIGFGLTSTYHADNEYCQLSDMKNAAKILSAVVQNISL